MKTKKYLGVRIRPLQLLLSTTGAALLLSTAVAFGQTAPQSSATTTASGSDVVQMDKYNVTGSYIPYAADAPAVPIKVIGQDMIQSSGISGNLLDLLTKQVPQFVGNGNLGSDNANIEGNWTNGGSMLKLRNVQTLVLINGRRAAFSPAGATPAFNFVDINTIPVSAIERVEILKDGASAIYGSDAVSGVVNIILKKDFDGVEVGGGYKFATQGHWAERSVRAIAGGHTDKTSVTVSFEWVKTTPLYQSQRDFSADQTGKTSNIPGYVTAYDADTFAVLGSYLPTGKPIPPGTSMTPDALVAAGYYYDAATSAALKNKFNLAPYVTLLMGNARTGLTADIEHKLNEQVQAFGDILYSTTHTYTQLAAQPISYIPFMTEGSDGGFAPPGELGNPFDNAYAYVRNRFVGHPRSYDSVNESLRLLAGLRGNINKDWYWETAVNYNIVQQDYIQDNVINRLGLANALADGVVNMFAPVQEPGALDNNVFGTAYQHNTSTLLTWDARLNGAINNVLPAGPIQFALGVEARRETLKGTPDNGSLEITDMNDDYYTQPMLWDGALTFSPFEGARTVLSAFLQVRVPVVSPKQKIPGLYTLDLDAAARFEHYSDTQSPLVPKILLRYLPFNNQLALRASYSTSFNAPDLFSLIGYPSVGYTSQIYLLRNNGGPDIDGDQANGYSPANPNLKPEKARTYNLGIVYSPKAIKGLTLEATYFYIKQSDLIATPSDQDIMQDVEDKGADSQYWNQVRIGSFTGPRVTGPGQLSASYDAVGGSFSNVYVTTYSENLSSASQDGIDLTAQYDINTRAGMFSPQVNATWYNRFRVDGREYAGSTTGNATLNGGTLPRWSLTANIDWKHKGWSATLYGRYIPSVTDMNAPDNDNKVKSFTRFDASVGYAIRKGPLKGVTVRAGVNNIFNAMPPLAPYSWTDANADIGTYGCLGRVVYIDASYKF